MNFLRIFKKKKNGQTIRVDRRKQNIIHDAALAVAFTDEGEHETARRMIDRTRGSRTILMVVNGDSSPSALNNYALEMAKRLDYELLALHVTEAPLAVPEEMREAVMSSFRESCAGSVQTLQKQGRAMGVAVNSIIDCGNQDDVVAKLHAEYPGMRYVLTAPDPDIVRSDAGQAEIPVFDLGCYHPSTA